MALRSGTKLGSFEVVSLLGKGGMGEVYRARDTKLGREVAIKVLPEAFASDEERLNRFEREARLLASLNHPNVATVHGFETAVLVAQGDRSKNTPLDPPSRGELSSSSAGSPFSDGEVRFLVMELVEGDTLEDRIARGALGVKEALPLFVQIAEGLDAAHEQGIIHRDLKPANIKITPDGNVKILDFGLAASIGTGFQPAHPDDKTTPGSPPVSALTTDGQILGTPSYMSPEQARGKPVDKRTDVWAFGCCLYETLTGVSPFHGETPSDTIAAILEREPDASLLPDSTPLLIRHLLFNCLEKNMKDRPRDVGDIRIQMQRLLAESGTKTVATSQAGSSIESNNSSFKLSWTSYAALFAVGLGGIVAGVLLSFLRSQYSGNLPASLESPLDNSPVQRTMKEFTVTLPEEAPIWLDGITHSLAISPNGRHIVYSTAASDQPESSLYLLNLSSGEGKNLPGTERAKNPFFSRDGEWVGFFTNDSLNKVSITGRSDPIALMGTSPVTRGGAWSSDGRIAFSPVPMEPLAYIPNDQDGAFPLTSLKPEMDDMSHRWPQFLPDNETILFTMFIGEDFELAQNARIVLESLDTSDRVVMVEGSRYGRYVRSGHIVYSRGASLMARAVDPTAWLADSPERTVLEDVMTNLSNDLPQFAVSDEGTLVYVRGGLRDLPAFFEPVWVDRSQTVTSLGLPEALYRSLSLSPTEDARLAIGVDRRGIQNIWMYDLSSDEPAGALFTSEIGREFGPVWSPDGERIAYTHFLDRPPNIVIRPTNGGAPRFLVASPNADFPNSWSPDGQNLVFVRIYIEAETVTVNLGNSDLWIQPIEEEQAPYPWYESPFREYGAQFSPDGEWLAYTSEEEGIPNIYVEPFDRSRPRTKVSPRGGSEVRWHSKFPEVRELFFLEDGKMMVSEGIGDDGAPKQVRELFRGDYWRNTDIATPISYDVGRNGERFLMLRRSTNRPAPILELTVIVNWFEELKRLVPLKAN